MNPINKKRKINTVERTTELFELMHKGDKNAREEIILDHLNMVKHFAKKHSRDVDTFHCIYDEGVIGLIKAVDRFNPNVGVKFTTYAYPYIQGAIIEYLRYRDEEKDQPLKARDYNILVAANRALDEKDRFLSYYEIAEMTGYDAKDIELVMETVTNKTRLESLVPDMDETITIMELVGSGHNTEQDVMKRIKYQEICSMLSEEELHILQRYYVDGVGQTALGKEVGISQAQVCRRLKKATERFKDLYLAY